MKRKNRNKWYKSKGGWIGVIVSILFMLISVNKGFSYSNMLQYLGLPNFSLGLTGFYELLTISLGFLTGYFIQKKFFKKGRK